VKNIEKMINVNDYAEQAQVVLPPEIWNYLDGGAEDEWSRANNNNAFNKYKLLPRILNDVQERSLTTTVLGTDITTPMLLAPTSPLRLMHEEAEIAQVKAADSLGTVAICSMDSHYDLEYLAKSGGENLWFQLYCYGSRNYMKEVISRVNRANYKALVITVDAFYPPRRERMMRSGFVLPSNVEMGNLTNLEVTPENRRNDGSVKRFALTWSDLQWIREATSLPIVIKGIMHEEDAAKAVDLGVDALVVSNHGGRQLDQVPSTIDSLSSIVRRIEGRAEVLLVGGIMRGTDVLKALALGAKAVLLGRSYVYGLVVDGQNGVEHVYNILRDEIDNALTQMGVSNIADLNSSSIIYDKQ